MCNDHFKIKTYCLFALLATAILLAGREGATAQTWTATGNLNLPRAWSGFTGLTDGRFLIAGGADYLLTWVGLHTAELYDPTTGTWTLTANLNQARAAPAILLLDGSVLLAGGWDGPTYLDTAEIYTSSPDELVVILAERVIELNLQEGITNSLDAKLDVVMKALDDLNENNDAAALNTLEAFINAVEAQRGKKITDEQADELIVAAQRIIDLVTNT